MTDGPQSPALHSTLDPIAAVADIKSIKSSVLIAPSKTRLDGNTIIGVPLRYIEIESDLGRIFAATVPMVDVAFLCKSLAELLDDDVAICSDIGNFKVAGRSGDMEKLRRDLEVAREKIDSALQRLASMEMAYPKTLKSDDESIESDD